QCWRLSKSTALNRLSIVPLRWPTFRMLSHIWNPTTSARSSLHLEQRQLKSGTWIVNNLFDVSGKIALVTGGANGLGRMIVEGLIEAGATVYFTSRKPEDCARTEQELSIKGRCHGIAADISTPEAASALARDISEKEPALHILINNAGKTWGAPLESFPDKAWGGVMSVNVQAPFTLI